MLKIDNIEINIGDFSLKNVSFEVNPGEYFVILGLSGVGKSLLLESVAGIISVKSGSIFFNNENITHKKIQNRGIGIVYQDATLFPHMTVFDNIAYPVKSQKNKNYKEDVTKIASDLGIADKLHRYPDTLSGGEYQRVALARSIITGNKLILLDEPLASLDSKSKRELITLLRRLNKQGITFVHVTHDYEEAVFLADKIGIMENGRMVQTGTPDEVLKHPKSEFIAKFIGIKNFFEGTLLESENELKSFVSAGVTIFCLTEFNPGYVYLTLGSEEIVISNEPDQSSMRNHFKGIITDIVAARVGKDVFVNAGLEFVVTVSTDAVDKLNLFTGKEVWLNFKASVCKIIDIGNEQNDKI